MHELYVQLLRCLGMLYYTSEEQTCIQQNKSFAPRRGVCMFFIIHERCNECSCQRDHILSSFTREDTRLDTQEHCLTKHWQAKRTLFESKQKKVHLSSGCMHDVCTFDNAWLIHARCTKRSVKQAYVCTFKSNLPPTPKHVETQSLNLGPIRMHVPLTKKRFKNVRRWPNCLFKCPRTVNASGEPIQYSPTTNVSHQGRGALNYLSAQSLLGQRMTRIDIYIYNIFRPIRPQIWIRPPYD